MQKKIPYYSWSSPHAFPKKKLFLNILKKADDIEMEYDFRFLTDQEAQSTDTDFWFECGKVLDFTDLSKVMEFLMLNGLMDTSRYTKEQSTFALNTINQFFNVIHQEKPISFFLGRRRRIGQSATNIHSHKQWRYQIELLRLVIIYCNGTMERKRCT